MSLEKIPKIAKKKVEMRINLSNLVQKKPATDVGNRKINENAQITFVLFLAAFSTFLQ